jgi:hypothetical protein
MKADQEAQKVMSPEGATEEIRVLTAAISKWLIEFERDTALDLSTQYKMRFVHAHFRVNHFFGEKRVRKVPFSQGVTYVGSALVKGQTIISGIDMFKVSQDSANITQMCLNKEMYIRKFWMVMCLGRTVSTDDMNTKPLSTAASRVNCKLN